jgi:hypothetical protein
MCTLGPVWHNLFHSFFIEISSSRAKQKASSVQLISSAASQNELKAENKFSIAFQISCFFNKQQLCQTGHYSCPS